MTSKGDPMSDTTWDSTRYAPSGKITYQRFAVVGSVAPDAAEATVADLQAAGASDDEIVILTEADRDRFDVPERGGGFGGWLQRLTASTGGDLDMLTAARRELDAGRRFIEVKNCRDEDRRKRMADIFRQHDARRLTYLNAASIDSLDGEPLG